MFLCYVLSGAAVVEFNLSYSPTISIPTHPQPPKQHNRPSTLSPTTTTAWT